MLMAVWNVVRTRPCTRAVTCGHGGALLVLPCVHSCLRADETRWASCSGVVRLTLQLDIVLAEAMNVSAFGGVSVSLADVTNTSSASTGSEFALGPGGVFIDSLAYAPSKSHYFEHDCDSDTDWILYDDRIACFFL